MPPFGGITASIGSSTGRDSSGTGTTPQCSQYTTGIGVPQYLWRLMSQSRRRYCVSRFPQPFSSNHAPIFSIASGVGRPSNWPELHDRPSASVAAVIFAGSGIGSPSVRTTGIIPSPYFLTKSKSRWSCAGTPIIAPVP